MLAQIDPGAAQSVIGGIAGIVLGVVITLLLIAVGAIVSFRWLRGEWKADLDEHEVREADNDAAREARERERHQELKDLIAGLQERVDRLYERKASA